MTREPNRPAGDNTTSGQNVPKSPKGLKTKKSKFRMESEQEKISKSKLRMEQREDKLNRARKKLDAQKPSKPRGPVRRALGAAGWNVHGFVHGKIYEVEHENVGTEGAHRSELVGEGALRHGTRYVKSASGSTRPGPSKRRSRSTSRPGRTITSAWPPRKTRSSRKMLSPATGTSKS